MTVSWTSHNRFMTGSKPFTTVKQPLHHHYKRVSWPFQYRFTTVSPPFHNGFINVSKTIQWRFHDRFMTGSQPFRNLYTTVSRPSHDVTQPFYTTVTQQFHGRLKTVSRRFHHHSINVSWLFHDVTQPFHDRFITITQPFLTFHVVSRSLYNRFMAVSCPFHGRFLAVSPPFRGLPGSFQQRTADASAALRNTSQGVWQTQPPPQPLKSFRILRTYMKEARNSLRRREPPGGHNALLYNSFPFDPDTHHSTPYALRGWDERRLTVAPGTKMGCCSFPTAVS